MAEQNGQQQQGQPAVMGSEEESFESLGSRSNYTENDDFVFTLDPSLLIDYHSIKLRRVIAEGPNSIVREGLYDSMPVAVKIIQADYQSKIDPERKEKFQREVTILSKMKHENIVKFIGATVEPRLMIVTELMTGGTLQSYLWSARPGPLDWRVALGFALDLSRVMEFLHENGVIHRDLKPSNVLLSEDKKQIKLADFGLAREISRDMTCEVGTYRWMAPEIFSMDPLPVGAKKYYDHKVDVYSFSIVLWELMTNETPYKGQCSVLLAYAISSRNVRPCLSGVPQTLVPLFQTCWSKNPQGRPEFRDITYYLYHYYCSLFQTVVRSPSPPPLPPAQPFFDIMEMEYSDGIDSNYDDMSDMNIVENYNEDSQNMTHSQHLKQPENKKTIVKKKKWRASRRLIGLLRCFTCFPVYD